MRLKIIFIFSLIITGMIACEKPIILDLPPYQSKLVVNGEFENGKTLSVKVSRSLPVMQSVDSTGFLIQDAIVKFYEDNVLIGNGTYFDGAYILNATPVIGKTYRVEASYTNYPNASATISLPGSIVLNSNYIDSVGLDQDGFKYGRLDLSFTDKAGENNYYRLFIEWYNPSTLKWSPLEFSSNDPIFLNNEAKNDGSYLFNDRTFEGKNKSFGIDIPLGTASGTPKFAISFKTFSEEYSRYLAQIDNYSNRDAGDFDPVILNTNVTNGLGMVGGVYNFRDTIY